MQNLTFKSHKLSQKYVNEFKSYTQSLSNHCVNQLRVSSRIIYNHSTPRGETLKLSRYLLSLINLVSLSSREI
jgi:hypothetical protein